MTGTVDQIDGILHFEPKQVLPDFDKQIQSLCFQVNNIIEKGTHQHMPSLYMYLRAVYERSCQRLVGGCPFLPNRVQTLKQQQKSKCLHIVPIVWENRKLINSFLPLHSIYFRLT